MNINALHSLVIFLTLIASHSILHARTPAAFLLAMKRPPKIPKAPPPPPPPSVAPPGRTVAYKQTSFAQATPLQTQFTQLQQTQTPQFKQLAGSNDGGAIATPDLDIASAALDDGLLYSDPRGPQGSSQGYGTNSSDGADASSGDATTTNNSLSAPGANVANPQPGPEAAAPMLGGAGGGMMSGGGGMMGGGGGVPQNTNANSMIREGQALNQAMAQNSEASANSAEVAKKKKAAAMAAGTSTDTPENGFIYDSQDSGLSTLPPAAVRRAPVAPRILTAVPRNISATSRS